MFIGVLSYSHYAYVEAFPNEKQRSWITAHVHMFEYFGGVAKILIPDNCMTAVNHNKGWNSQEINSVYREMAEHYGTVVIPARVRKPKDKPTAEGTVGVISTWITAALRHSQFYSLEELNRQFTRSCRNSMTGLHQAGRIEEYALPGRETLPASASGIPF